MSEITNCPRCGQLKLFDFPKPLLLPMLYLENGEMVVNPTKGLSVSAKCCDACGFVEFKFIKDSEITERL